MDIDIVDYRPMRGDVPPFKVYLRSGPDVDDLELLVHPAPGRGGRGIGVDEGRQAPGVDDEDA